MSGVVEVAVDFLHALARFGRTLGRVNSFRWEFLFYDGINIDTLCARIRRKTTLPESISVGEGTIACCCAALSEAESTGEADARDSRSP